MKEIGGFIELDNYRLPMMHEGALALNCGRNALAYLLRAKKIKTLYVPKLLCDSVTNVCVKEGIEIKFYSVNSQFCPTEISLKEDEWVYIVNYYGQIKNEELNSFAKKYKRIIVDNAQAYFQTPIYGIDTLYTCRKFFGVADGAFLYTDCQLEEELLQDESFERMHFLLGRYERSAADYYAEYVDNNRIFKEESIKKMSKLTNNLLHGIDYEWVKNRRTENFMYLHEKLKEFNQLTLSVPEGAFMYPFYIKDGSEIRRKMQQIKIYIPTLWPSVFEWCREEELEYDMAKNMLPIPVDQRYDLEDMKYIIDNIMRIMKAEEN